MFARFFVTLAAWLAALALPACHKEKEPPPVAADDVVFHPSDTVYPREPQVVQGRPSSPDLDFIATGWPTVTEVAQVYADFSRKEVRVPRSLLDRQLSMGRGTGKVAAGYVITTLDGQLPYEGVEIEQLGRGVVRFRAGQTYAEKMMANRPPPATPAQVVAARAAMPDDRFWSMIATARGGGANDCFKTAETLTRALQRLPEEDILGFHVQFRQRMQESYRWDLWGVAYLVNGGSSDDGFEYFRAWLVSQGREYFAAALQNPERAADRACRRQDNECEQMLYAASRAYEAKTKRPLPIVAFDHPSEPSGTPWNEEDLPRLYPELAKKIR